MLKKLGALLLSFCFILCKPPDSLDAAPASTVRKLEKTGFKTSDPEQWRKVDQLVSEQKLEAASAEVTRIRELAFKNKDDANYTRALIKEVQLRVGLHGYETSVRFLRESPWPESALGRIVVDLYYGFNLLNYLDAYSWEINQREKVSTSKIVDLKAWTKDQLFTEALKAYDEVWTQRSALGTEPQGILDEYINVGSYPPRIRGTLRDSVTYLTLQLLQNTTRWRPEQINEVYRLDFGALLTGGKIKLASLNDEAQHPIEKMMGMLDDLEAWHKAAGRTEAALEARLERYRRLAASFTDKSDQKKLREALAETLNASRALPWWSEGQALLAEFVRDQENDLVKAHAIASEGASAYPNESGGQHCNTIARSIELPHYQLQALNNDGLGKRSIQVTHKNLERLYFRAFRFDLLKRIESAQDYNLLPNYNDVQKILKGTPTQTWEAALPKTPDYQTHTTYVTPALKQKGAYIIEASTRSDFGDATNRLGVLAFIASDLVITEHVFGGERIEVTVLHGETGRPVPSARVAVYAFDYQRKHHEVESGRTGSDGLVSFRPKQNQSYFVVAQKDDDATVDAQAMYMYRYQSDPPREASLIFTDRSVYRPEQSLQYKVVSYSGNKERTQFSVNAKSKVSVSLFDGNNQLVESKELSTNEFGSASGAFKIPTGRLLGGWSLRTSNGGYANVRVEEYKRPTFEVSFKQAEGALRLNQPAEFVGEAKYYFGLPVTNGTIKYRVTRQQQYPWWWFYWYWSAPNTSPQQMAQGVTKLDDKGQFKVAFTPAADERGDKSITYSYSVHADLTDEGGETRSADRSFRLGFVSVEATLSLDHGFVLENDDAQMRIRRTNLDGAGRAGEASYKLLEIKQPAETPLPADIPLGKGREGYVTEGDALRPRHAPSYSSEQLLASWADGKELRSGPIKHDANGDGVVAFGKLAPGAYRVRYSTKDDFGQTYENFRNFIVAGKRTPVRVPGLFLIYDATVAVGGTARVLLHSGLKDQTLVYERWRGPERLERRLLASDEPSLIEIPVAEIDRGGFGVGVYAERDHQAMTFAGGIMVPWDNKALDVSFSTFRDTLRPGTKEKWQVTVKAKTTQKAEAGAAEILAYMYDKSLDVFAPHSAPSPLSLYATRWGAASPRINLQAAWEIASYGHGWSVPGYPSFYGESLRFYHSYGIGGLGQRGRFYGHAAAMPMAAPSAEAGAPPPPPPSPAIGGATRSRSAAESRDDGVADKLSAQAPEMKAPAAQAQASAQKGPEIRSNFAETAFFLPHLVSSGDGSATIEFTVPDSVTAYNVWVHAVTKDLRGGSLHKESKAVKELMVRPYMPRFLREGDKADLKVVVNNAGDKALSGEVSFEIYDPETNKSLADEFGLSIAKKPFTMKAGSGSNVSFAFTAPKRVGIVAFKVVAKAGDWSDGELRPLPILPSRMHLAQSKFVTLHDKQSRTMVFDDLKKNDDPSLINEKLVVTLDAQLFYTVLKALPYLLDYPYECAEQTLNRFVSGGILSSLYTQFPAIAEMAKGFSTRDTRLETFDAPDPNRRMTLEESPWVQEAKGGEDIPSAALVNVLDPAAAKRNRDSALGKLRKMQTANGAFPWFPGGPPSPYITLYLIHGFAKAAEFQVDVPKDMVQRAWAYTASHIKDDVFRCMRAHDGCWEMITFVNYVLTSFPDKSWGQEAFSDAERSEMLAFSFRHWKQHSPMLKAYLALTLKRMNRLSDGRLVFESVMDSAKNKEDQGTFWAPEDRSWLWYNDTIETHALALRTLTELIPEHNKRDGLVLWLLLNKKLNHWKSTRATAEVIYSLAHYMKADKSLGVREEAKVTIGDAMQTFVFEPTKYVGKTQIVVPGEQVVPEKTSTIKVEKETKGFMFASATWHFSTERLPKEDRGDFFKVSRTYFKRENNGKEFVLKPLADGAILEAGDELEVQLSLRTKHEAEYVHLRDPRGAGFEPDNAVSRYKWDLGLSWYEEYRDSGTNFFFEKLPVGEYTFKYRIRVAMGGTFRVGPAVVQSMYAPEFVAYSQGHVLNVK